MPAVTSIVTGGNSGIGKEAAVGIASAGAHVVVAARNAAKAAAANSSGTRSRGTSPRKRTPATSSD